MKLTFPNTTISPPVARPYNSALSLWLSVDPLSDKYPNLSPYTYCANNPVRLVDVDGREIWIGGYQYAPGENCPIGLTGDDAEAWNSLNYIANHKLGGKVVAALYDSKKKYSISTGYTEKNPNYDANKNSVTGKKGGCGGTINIIKSVASMDQTLSHELFHAYQDEKGQYGNNVHNEVEAFMFEALVCGEGKGNFSPNATYPMTDPYIKAVFAFENWGDNMPSSETDFNNVSRPI